MISRSLQQSNRIMPIALGLVLLVCLAYQFKSLYYFPQFDGARYWGDEFGQIIELKTELERGYAAIPTGKGATVEVTNGIIRGNSWLAAVVYGLPALIFYPAFDLVAIGRTVTTVLSLVLLYTLYWALRRFGVSHLVAIGALLILVTNRSFLFASHTARLDIAAGLAVLAWCAYCTLKYRELLNGRWAPTDKWYFLFGAITFASSTFSIHLLTLLGPVAVFAIWRFGKGEFIKAALLSVAGVIAVAALLFGSYALTGAPITLFGETSHHLQSHDVLNAMPAFRPFSWSVQSSNLIQRFEQFRAEAPFVAVLFIVSFIICAIKWSRIDRHTRFLIACCAIITICWLEFQSSAVYYFLHITPLMVFTAIMILRVLQPKRWRLTLALGCIALVPLHIADIAVPEGFAELRDRMNRKALSAVERRLPADDARILAQYPAVSLLHRTLGDRLMTTHFVNFPVDSSSVDEVLRQQRVSTMLLYTTDRAQDYSFEVEPLWEVARRRGRIDTVFTGELFDVALENWDSGTADSLIVIRLDQ